MQLDLLNRREFTTLLGASASIWPVSVLGQGPKPLIGFLGAASKTSARYYSGFTLGMRDWGYMDGLSYTLVDRYADGEFNRLPALAEELVRLKPDVIVASNTAAAVATKQATASIPIVCTALSDVAILGVGANDARPAANVTGIRTVVEGLLTKHLEIAIDLILGITKIAFLLNVNSPAAVTFGREVESASTKLGVTLVRIEARTPEEIGPRKTDAIVSPSWSPIPA